MLDKYAARHKVRGHSLIATFDAPVFVKAQKYCRVVAVANNIRLAIEMLRSRGYPPSRWRNAHAWKCVLSARRCISAHTCVLLYCLAIDCSKRDWATECNIFRACFRSIPEDADQSAWDHPRMENVDLRCSHLDALANLRCMGMVDTTSNSVHPSRRKSDIFKLVHYILSRRSIQSVRLLLVFLTGTATKKARFIPLNLRR